MPRCAERIDRVGVLRNTHSYGDRIMGPFVMFSNRRIVEGPSALCRRKVGVLGLVAVTLAGWLTAVAAAAIPAQQAKRIEHALPVTAPAVPRTHRRVLVFLTPPHLMPKDPHKGDCIPYGAFALQSLGKKTGAYEAVVSDDLAMFLPDHISRFDAVVLNNTSGDWIIPTQEQVKQQPFNQYGSDVKAVETVLRNSLLGFVRDGGGLMAVHYAIGGNRNWPEFADLLGAAWRIASLASGRANGPLALSNFCMSAPSTYSITR